MKNKLHLRAKKYRIKKLQDIPCQAAITKPRFLNPKISKINLVTHKTSEVSNQNIKAS